VPLALATPGPARRLAGELAGLVACQRATLAPSTLHAFWDLFGMPSMRAAFIHVDAGAYPIARWGIERAVARGTPAGTFAHHDPVALARALASAARSGRRPVVVADGVCPGCAAPLPLAAYLELVGQAGGCLVVDDTQALGVLGEAPGPEAPFGRGGGGSLRFHGRACGTGLLLVSSLAKGFGVPLAVLAGDAAMVAAYEEASETRTHTSPPSFAHLHAAAHALAVNRVEGDGLRAHLAAMVARFRRRLAGGGLRLRGFPFPVQSLAVLPEPVARALHRRLLRLGVRAVLQRPCRGPGARLSFVITARHEPREVDRAADVLLHAAPGGPSAGFTMEVHDAPATA
jgi:8-amino-7-oxononanoate synthase